MLAKRTIQYPGFGNCLEIANDFVRVVVTLDFGPRVIRYSFTNGENILYEDTDRVFFSSGKAFDERYGEGSVWYVYGGHRIWTAPEKYPQTYYPDNDPVDYQLTASGAVFTAPVQRVNQYGYTLEVSLREDSSEVQLRYRVTNYGQDPVTLAPWAITALSQGGTEIVPQPDCDTFTAPNRQIALWPSARMTDRRLTWLDRYMILRQDREAKRNFKFGINSQHGFAMYFNRGDLFVKRFPVIVDGYYPDGGMSFETFTNGLFLEMESLGELKTLMPGESTCHTETWTLFKAELPELTDEMLDSVTAKYIP